MVFLVRHHGGGTQLECSRCHGIEPVLALGKSAWLAAVHDFQARHSHPQAL